MDLKIYVLAKSITHFSFRYEDKEIKGSPFVAKVTGGEDIAKEQLNKIKVTGKALTDGRTKLTNEITIGKNWEEMAFTNY